jgi:hypothetical protein
MTSLLNPFLDIYYISGQGCVRLPVDYQVKVEKQGGMVKRSARRVPPYPGGGGALRPSQRRRRSAYPFPGRHGPCLGQGAWAIQGAILHPC